jgi:endonuclease III
MPQADATGAPGPIIAVNAAKRRAIFERLAAAIPEPTTELRYASPFELLVAVVLSAQATDKGVNKATALLFPAANTPKAMLALGELGLKAYIKTIGLFNSKAKNLIQLCRILLERHGGRVPETREELEALPGVGRKTANVMEVENKLDKWVPGEHKKDAHHLLILHGRYTCIARKPRCGSCVIADLCEFPDKTEPYAPPAVNQACNM